MSVALDGDRDGATYQHSADYQRLNGQARRVFDALADQQWHTLADLAALTSSPEASVSARLRDFRKARFGSWVVERERVSRGLWRYRLTGERIEQAEPAPPVPQPEKVTIAVTRSRAGRFAQHTPPDGDQPSLFADRLES